MGNIMISAMKNLKNKSECVEMPEVYASFAKIPIAPKEIAEMRIKPIPINLFMFSQCGLF